MELALFTLWKRLRHFLAIFLLLLAIFIGLAISLTPFISRYRLELQTWISQELQQPIQVAYVTGRWRNLGPTIEFNNVVIYDDAKTQILLAVKQLDVDINLWRSLINHKLVFHRVGIAGADIILAQTPEHQIILAGAKLLNNNTSRNGLAELLSWLDSEQDLQLTNINLTWQNAHGKQFKFDSVNLLVSNHNTRHHLQGTAILNHIPLQFQMQAHGKLENWQQLQIRVNLSAQGLSMPEWFTPFMPTDYHWLQGLADIEISTLWDQKYQQWQQVQAKITAKDVKLASQQYDFAAKNCTTILSWRNDNTGYLVNFDGEQLKLNFGKLFRAPLPLQSLATDFALLPQEQGWQWQIKSLVALQGDAALQTQGTLVINPQHKLPWLDLKAHITAASIQQLSLFLPAGILAKDLTHWLDQAFIQAKGGSADVILHGNLANFPFSSSQANKEQFIVNAQLDDVNLRYWPSWPLAEHLTGKLVFNGARMDAYIQQGQIINTPITAHAYIPVMSRKKPAILHLEAQAKGALDALHKFLLNSPLQQHFAYLKPLQCKGDSQLQFNLSLPLEQNKPSQHLPWQLKGRLSIQQGQLQLANSPLMLTHLRGILDFTNNSLTANQVQANLLGFPSQLVIDTTKEGIQVGITSQIDVDTLAKALTMNKPSWLSGHSNYQAMLKFKASKRSQIDLNITSDLNGIAINLPPPFTKLPTQAQKFSLQAFMQDQMPVKITGQYELQTGSILRATLLPHSTLWQIDLSSPQLAGRLTIPKQASPRLKTVWQANLQKLYLTPGLVTASVWHPSDFPALRLQCQDTRYGKKIFGQVQLEIDKLANGISIKRLQARTSAFNLTANGSWQEVEQKLKSELKGSLSTQNIAEMLQSFGLPARIEGQQGTALFDLQWPGAIYAPRLTILKGTLAVTAKKGRIINMGTASSKIDLGRLLSVLSLQTLTRRLQLDFSDLTKQGYTFDQMRGNFSLHNGNAFTQNTLLDGPVAQLELLGRIGIVREDYGLSIKVTPHLTSSLPVIVALAGGPVAGAVTWAADRVLGAQLNKIATYFYQVNGSWENPNIIEVKSSKVSSN
jgi:uncharacterized protein YhdP